MQQQSTMKPEWHWMKGGLVVSMLSILTYVLFEALEYKNYPFGITAGYGFVVGKLGSLGPVAADNPVIRKFNESPAALIEFAMLIGIAGGAFIAAKRSGSYQPETIPAVWARHVDPRVGLRLGVVVLGGFLMGLGAVVAGGCTTGNILQGWAHLSPGSMTAGIAFFAGGIAIVRFLYRGLEGER